MPKTLLSRSALKFFREMGRKGGRVSSPAKAAAARANAKLPRKKVVA